MLKITAKLVGLGGYFFVLLLPIVYPSPNAVNTRLIIAIRLSIVIIRITLFFHISIPCTDLYVNGGSQSLRGGLTAYHPGSPKEILPHFDRDFNRIRFGVGKVAGSIINITITSQRYKMDWKTLILSGFQSKCPLFELNRRRRLPRAVIHHPVNPLHFIHNPARHLPKHFPRNLCTLRRHKITGCYCP